MKSKWSDVINKVPLTRMSSTSIELPNGQLMEPPRFTEDELAFIRESIYLRNRHDLRKQYKDLRTSILLKIPTSLSVSK